MKSLARPQDRAGILGRLRQVRPDGAARWGRMSAHQMVCHLADGFRMATGQLVAKPVGGYFHRGVLKWIVLYAPVRWPAGIPTSPEIDQQRQGTPPADFAADVAQVEALVERVAHRDGRFEWQAHPLFGSMSDAQWMRWGYRHMDHHLRQFGV